MDYQIAYNPYKVYMKISIKDKNGWTPISQDSSLARFSRVRLQRCLNGNSDNSFFQELADSAGDDEIDISFLGTAEDYMDLQAAAFHFTSANPNLNISLQRQLNSDLNSAQNKYAVLLEIAANAKEHKYSFLIPSDIWNGISQALTLPSNEETLVPLVDWETIDDEIFSEDSWKMFCFEFRYEELKSKALRNAFKRLSKRFECMTDRAFERERFLLICRYADSIDANYNVLRKVLMEYGVQDIDFTLIGENDYRHLDDPYNARNSMSLCELQQHIIAYKNRYAGQYKLKKSLDVVKNAIQANCLTPGPKLKRKIDSELRDKSTSFSDREVEEAYNWLINLLDKIDHVLELET